MLVLDRKQGQQIVIGEDMVVTVLEVRGTRVKLGFLGPAEVPILRKEIDRRGLGPACEAPLEGPSRRGSARLLQACGSHASNSRL